MFDNVLYTLKSTTIDSLRNLKFFWDSFCLIQDIVSIFNIFPRLCTITEKSSDICYTFNISP